MQWHVIFTDQPALTINNVTYKGKGNYVKLTAGDIVKAECSKSNMPGDTNTRLVLICPGVPVEQNINYVSLRTFNTREYKYFELFCTCKDKGTGRGDIKVIQTYVTLMFFGKWQRSENKHWNTIVHVCFVQAMVSKKNIGYLVKQNK